MRSFDGDPEPRDVSFSQAPRAPKLRAEFRGKSPAFQLSWNGERSHAAWLSLCDATTLIEVNELRFASQGYRRPIESRGTGIFKASPEGRAAWREPAVDFIDAIRARWPDAVRFTDDKGRFVPSPPQLAPEGDPPPPP
jgi:hypothetical protein